MYVSRIECDDCGPRGCTCVVLEVECKTCGHALPTEFARIPGTPYLFCWNCVRTGRPFDPRGDISPSTR